MKYILLLISSLFLFGCTDAQVKLHNLRVIIDNIDCPEPSMNKLNLLNEEKYVAERGNIKTITDNTIVMTDYIKKLEVSNQCFKESFSSLKEEKVNTDD